MTLSPTDLDTPAVDAALSTLMRDGSRAEHTAAEGSTFMSALLDGGVNASGYVAYLRRLREVYATLEQVGCELSDDPVVAAVHDRGLERLTAIDADLAFWQARIPDASDRGEPLDSPATTSYQCRLEESRAWGGLYAAHHYTRYLGDLSGGQAIGRILDRSFDLGGRGIAFYDFPAVPKPKLYKDAYRGRLDALALSSAEKLRIVEEVKVAFNLNQALFAELSDSLADYRR
ncbi:MAG: biliverdin-producing heme oxygenase [Nocardioides sp.]|uniref:biliverdin-producing heme oxygenase n=1 Tax=Nocardioides sp. TaxID=35761 RepID=UPI0039E6B39A